MQLQYILRAIHDDVCVAQTLDEEGCRLMKRNTGIIGKVRALNRRLYLSLRGNDAGVDKGVDNSAIIRFKL